MSKHKRSKPCTTEVEAVLMMLSLADQATYVSTLYSIAQDAIQSQCRGLKAMDLEVKALLEEKGNANFEEWFHCIVERGEE